MTPDGPVFRDPHGSVVPETFERTALEQPLASLQWRILANGIEIDPGGQIPDWDGSRPDYEHVVYALTTHGGPPAA